MASQTPLLSVVVPTHNRSIYAAACIAAVLGFDSPNLQLVMTDTSTDHLLYDMLHGELSHYLDDQRFIYRKIDEPSSLTKNHNDALALAQGQYVCVIGDDDCITEAALEAARWASQHDAPVVSQTVTATYAWPDFKSRLARNGHAARLYVPRKVAAPRWRDGASDLAAALDRAFQATDGMPRCYHGIVRRDLLEQIRAKTGAYFHGSSPDMSGAVSLACLVNRYLEVDIPLTIPGVSGGSNSGRSAMNTHKGKLSSETQTSGFEQSGWEQGVPRFFAVETVWAHAGLASLRQLRPDLVPSFNFARLLAICEVRHPEFAPAVTAAALEMHRPVPDSVTIVEKRREKSNRVKYLVRRALNPTAANGRRYFANIKDVAEASRQYEAYAKAESLRFQEPV